MAIIQLPTDFQDLLKCLNKNGVDYLLIGGYAVGYYGYVRATGDIDFWFARTEENASRIVSALKEFGFGSDDVSVDTFMEPGAIIRMGREPLRVEFLTTISGVEFADCWPQRRVAQIEDIPVPVISLEDLKANKKASGRPKDLIDFKKLEQIR